MPQRFVKGRLLVAQLDLQRHFGARRQFLQHLRLRAAEDERLNELLQPPPRLAAAVAFDRHGKAISKTLQRTEQPRVDELEQVPQFAQVVFQRRAGHDQSEVRLESHRRLGTAGGHILDRLGFVQDMTVCHACDWSRRLRCAAARNCK